MSKRHPAISELGTQLLAAVDANDVATLRQLCEGQVLTTIDASQALDACAIHEDPGCVKVLLDHGAVDMQGHLLRMAIQLERDDLVDVLLQYPDQMNLGPSLLLAPRLESPRALERLLRLGSAIPPHFLVRRGWRRPADQSISHASKPSSCRRLRRSPKNGVDHC